MDVPVADLDDLLDTFLAVQARITANLEAHAAGLGLNASQLLVLRDVVTHPGTSLKDVCQRCGLKKSAASRLVDALAERTILVREPCPTSGRAVALRLGPALDGQFCKVKTVTAALPGWAATEASPDYRAAQRGLEAFLRLAQPPRA